MRLMIMTSENKSKTRYCKAMRTWERNVPKYIFLSFDFGVKCDLDMFLCEISPMNFNYPNKGRFNIKTN